MRRFVVFVLSLGFCVSIAVAARAQDSFSTQDCLDCHSDEELTGEGPGGETRSVFVNGDLFEQTVHGFFSCTDCHSEISELPHEEGLPLPSCGDCHDQADPISASVHANGSVSEAVTCESCHGSAHEIFAPTDPRSTVYPLNVYRTCGACHFEKTPPELGEAAPLSLERYQDDIHGHGIVKAGLIVSATCVSCHGSHDIVASTEPDSTVSPQHVVETCGSCHVGVARDFSEGAHGTALAADVPNAPTCVTCHRPHRIRRIEAEQVLEINRSCGECHDSRQKTYSETYHGKVTALGYTGVASCDKCHRAHSIFPASDPRSSINPEHIVSTCATCHQGANAEFASYLVHMDTDSLDAHPILHWASWGMTALLVSVFSFFGLHTALWLYRSRVEKRNNPAYFAHGASPTEQHVHRLTIVQRAMHAVIIVSFLGLALTGLPLKYSGEAWASWLLTVLGGFQTASVIHRFCAVLTFGYFLTHLIHISYRALVKHERGLFYGPDSMVPRAKDFADLFATFRWFFGSGERPRVDRWAYWEKFDYWAVFWGVAIIGSSGLIMAFPVFFTRFLPGWSINLALIVHSEEALLATGFIFAIHFFNTHLKPEKFPMDTVFYTGRIPLQEYERDHPLEVERLRKSGELESRLVAGPFEHQLREARFFGFIALTIGLVLLLLILGAELLR